MNTGRRFASRTSDLVVQRTDYLRISPERKAGIRRLAAELVAGRRVALSTHMNADGDGCGSETALASALTIGGFILTQMVLNQQRRRENALHLKIDEILLAMHGTRNEVAGIEQEAEEEIERLRAGRDAAP